VLRLPATKESSAPDYRILRNWRSRGYPKPRWTSYVVETEPGIQAVVYRLGSEQLISRPHADTKRAILYVAHQSSDAELRDEPLIREIIKAEPSTALYTVDVRGIGESRPDTCDEDSFLSLYGNDFFYASHSIMLDRPYLGQRTHDVLRVLDWLGSIGHDEVHIVGKGWGALPATFAAVLSDRVKQVTLKNALTSYQEIAESPDYAWPLSALVPNILAAFDLPDCYQALQAKNLRQIDPWGADAKPTAR
jgi:pimeloyl-ACP methyl ester carboxylesterase